MELILTGLDCANCAAKVEKKVSTIDGVAHANLDFISQKLTIETDIDEQIMYKTIVETIKNIEPHVLVLLQNEFKQRKNMPTNFLKIDYNIKRIIICTCLFTIGLLSKDDSLFSFIMFLIAYVFIGYDIIYSAIRKIFAGELFDENFLMFVATVGAFVIGDFSEGVAIMLLFQIGEYFQRKAVDHSRKSISALMDIKPDYANIKIGNEIVKVSPTEVKIGDVIVVKVGEKVPLDGIVIDGNSMIDASAITGESVPKRVTIGDNVLSGSVNSTGLISLKVVNEFAQSTVSKILALVENANSQKSKTEEFITKFSKIYTPSVLLIALLVATIPPLFLGFNYFSMWLYKALVFLVISCPCALVISIPLSFFGGIGSASKAGILIKGGKYLDALSKVDTVVFDKTGTLTQGVFSVTEINPTNGVTSDDLLKYVAYAEVYSNHPIGKSIVSKYNYKIDKSSILNYNEVSGYGIEVDIDGNHIIAGNKALLSNHNINFTTSSLVGTIVHVAKNNEYIGNVVISDIIKINAEASIDLLKMAGVKEVVMLTGDNEVIANQVANQLKFTNYFSQLLPHDKVNKLALLKSNLPKGKNIIFVGDGINDAPVLAMSDIGIAMGGVGSDAAIEASDVVIMEDDISKIADAINIAKKTKTIVFQNITFILIIKLLAMCLGLFGIATIWEAVIADVGVAIVAIINSTRTLAYNHKK